MAKARGPSVIGVNDEIADALPAYSESRSAVAVNSETVADKAPDIISLLPRIRLSARFLVKDNVAADKLVELTLERAVAATRSRQGHDDVEAWLTALLKDTFTRVGPDLRRLFPTQEK